jgi:hypothetical protein
MGNDGRERQIEMVWACSTCRTRNLGRFVACTGCGHPKDDSEEYEMPLDTDRAPTVVDAALLAMAEAGENWRCRYCRSHQRRLDGACASCGASAAEGTSPAESPAAESPLPRASTATAPVVVRRARFGGRRRLVGALIAAVVVALGAFVVVGKAVRLSHPGVVSVGLVRLHPRVLEVPVVGRAWEHLVVIDRWQKMPHEGFAEQKPAEAVDVQSLGQRQHHTERVLAGTRTEHYTERVSDGDRTETYTTRESCGQDCTAVPQTCREVCSSNKNGFATCRQQCSGGGQRCTTKRCTVTKTRSVPQYRNESRTREIPIYRDEPRFAAYFGWKTWQWGVQRRIAKTGTTEPPIWPTEAELAPPAPLAAGEKERENRSSVHTLSLRVPPPAETPFVLALPDEASFLRTGTTTSVTIYESGAGDYGSLETFTR